MDSIHDALNHPGMAWGSGRDLEKVMEMGLGTDSEKARAMGLETVKYKVPFP